MYNNYICMNVDGKWILCSDWISDSIKHNTIMREESYEVSRSYCNTNICRYIHEYIVYYHYLYR
jgi:hypothetical protein